MRKVIKLFPWKRQVQLFCLQLPIISLENRFPFFFVHILAVICTLFLFVQYSKQNSWTQVFVPQTYKTFTFWRIVMETRPLCLSGKSWSSKKEKKTEEASKEEGSGVSEYKKKGKRQGWKPRPASLLHTILSLPRIRRGVRSDAQLSCTDTQFQKCCWSGKMVLNTQCYQYLWLIMWFHAKKI